MPKVVTTPEWDTLLNTHNLDTVAGVYALNAAPQIIKHGDRKSTRLNSSHSQISYAGFCLKKKQRAGAVRAGTGSHLPRQGDRRRAAGGHIQRKSGWYEPGGAGLSDLPLRYSIRETAGHGH